MVLLAAQVAAPVKTRQALGRRGRQVKATLAGNLTQRLTAVLAAAGVLAVLAATL